MMIIKLAREVEQDYVQRGGKYQSDDGGPSYWWRDKALRELVQATPGNLGDHVIEQLDGALAEYPEELIPSLESFISNARIDRYGNAQELLRSFARSEQRKQAASIFLEILLVVAGGGLLASGIANLLSGAAVSDWLPALGVGVAGALGELAWRIWGRRTYFTTDRLNKYGAFEVRESEDDNG